ncbi:MAG: PrsW family intramembrane metalloprotease [Chloroflexi bacterium]|nr:PrsW family intramembrane metalloprotease [Chloroflexota bacterium]
MSTIQPAPANTGQPAPANTGQPAPANAGVRLHLLAVLFALLGGLLGILGALAAEGRTTVPLLIVFVGAPIIEEIVKPMGVYLFMIRWPHVLRNRLHIATLVMISGVCFGLIESLVYVTLYVPDHSQEFFIYRFTVTIALHAVASFIVGLGVSSKLIDWANGEAEFPRSAKIAFLGAIGLHAAYNITVTILDLTGVLNFG